jgi:hypothetical protein
MGHLRLGRIPKTWNWRGLFEALDSQTISPELIASSVAAGARTSLEELKRNRQVNYCFWFLVRVAAAGRSRQFESSLTELGLSGESLTSRLRFAASLSGVVAEGLRERGKPDVFGRMAELALRDTISREVLGPAPSLFGVGRAEIEAACRAIGTRAHFGKVARSFFSLFMQRVMQFVVDKEVSNFVGPGKGIAGPEQVVQFHERLSRYCFETARIVEEYAGGWFSKVGWETSLEISEQQTRGFTAYALEKILTQLREAA